MPDTRLLQKLKERWKLQSAFQVVMVLLVFTCTGFSVVFLKEPLYRLVGITEETSAWIKVPFYIIAILPVYQVILLLYGFLFGQFRFFWAFEKRIFSHLWKKRRKKSGV